jgi:hypothetical protein
MATLTLSIIRSLVRSGLNEANNAAITDTELNAIANDGYVNTAVKGLCYEQKITVSNIPASVDLIPLYGYNVVKVNYMEYSGEGLGMICINPQNIGHITIDGQNPQFWFQWGNFVKIEPLPDVATYSLNLYVSCYPTTAMTSDTDTPSLIPVEFHECVYLYTLAFACFKLKRWQDAITNYNRYAEIVQKRRGEYVSKFPETRANLDLPKTVRMGK